MSLKARRKVVSSIPPMDGGTYMGVCVAVVDLGQQYKQFEKQKQGRVKLIVMHVQCLLVLILHFKIYTHYENE